MIHTEHKQEHYHHQNGLSSEKSVFGGGSGGGGGAGKEAHLQLYIYILDHLFASSLSSSFCSSSFSLSLPAYFSFPCFVNE